MLFDVALVELIVFLLEQNGALLQQNVVVLALYVFLFAHGCLSRKSFCVSKFTEHSFCVGRLRFCLF